MSSSEFLTTMGPVLLKKGGDVTHVQPMLVMVQSDITRTNSRPGRTVSNTYYNKRKRTVRVQKIVKIIVKVNS